MLWTGSGVLAVDQDGHILFSPDGAAWSIRDSWGPVWHSIVRTGTGRYLVTSLDGYWALSGDGVDWSHGRGKPGIYAAAALGNRTLASDWDANLLFASADDTTWERVGADSQGLPPARDHIHGLAANGKIVVGAGIRELDVGGIGGGAGLAAVSEDGVTWRFRQVEAFPVAYHVRWAKDRFFAFGQGILASSLDGEAWSALEITNDDFPNDLVWTGKQFVLVGGLGMIRVSSDGVNWQPVRYQKDSQVYFNKAVWTGSRLVLAGVHQVAGRECRYIVTLDSDDLLPIRGEPSAPPRRSWEKQGDGLVVRPPAGSLPGRVRLFDLRGHAVLGVPFEAGSDHARLPLSGLGRGNFVLRVETGRARPATFLIPR